MLEFFGKKVVPGSGKKIRISNKKYRFQKKIYFQKIPKFKFYYAKWTLRIEVVNGNFVIYYCVFRVYLVTGTKKPDISQEGTSRIPKLFFYMTTRGTLKDGQTQFLRLFIGTHNVSQVAVCWKGMVKLNKISEYSSIYFE
jgi:hypothetical protein